MPGIDFGGAPLSLLVPLTKDSDFNRTIEPVDDIFVTGTEIKLVFGEAEWPADVEATAATWSVDKVDVNALIATNPQEARLVYKAGEVDLVWAIGVAVIYGA